MTTLTGRIAKEHAWDAILPQILDRWSPVFVAVISCATFLFRLGAIPLTSPNEGLYAQVAREMAETNDWVVPHINTLVYFEKPPLLYWLSALSYKLFGINAYAARLPSALAGAATTWLVFWLGRRLYSRTGATISALALASGLGFIFQAREVMFDTLLTAAITGALAGFWMVCGESTGRRGGDGATSATGRRGDPEKPFPRPVASSGTFGPRSLVYFTYAMLALAVLAKGFIGILVPLLVAGVYIAWSGSWARLRPLASLGGLLLFLAITVPWHVAAALRDREFVWFYFVNEHLLRFLGRRHPADFRVEPIYTPITGPLVLLFPWAVLVPAALYRAFAALRQAAGRGRAGTTFLLCWILVPILFFTVARTRTLYYMLPVVPPLALLIGGLYKAVSRADSAEALRRWVRIPLAIFFGGIFLTWIFSGAQAARHTLRTEGYEWAFLSAWWLVLGSGCALLLARKDRYLAAFTCLGVSSALTWMTALYAFVVWQKLLWAPTLAAAVVRTEATPRPLVALEGRLENHSGFVFYLPRRLQPVAMVDGRFGGDLEFGSHAPSARPLFLSLEEFRRLTATRELFYLTGDPPRDLLPPSFHLVRTMSNRSLWHSLPTGAGSL